MDEMKDKTLYRVYLIGKDSFTPIMSWSEYPNEDLAIEIGAGWVEYYPNLIVMLVEIGPVVGMDGVFKENLEGV